MTSLLAASPDLLGAQRPRLLSVPDFASTTGDEAIEVAALAGLHLDPWQQFVLTNALGEKTDAKGETKWAAFEVGVEVARQNGKGGLLEARELAGLFLLGERLIIHSAHDFATSLEAFRRLLSLIEDTPDFARRVKRVSNAHGKEGIELHGGQRIRFKTRTKGGGRGFSADCLILDEAMVIPEAMHGALLPTLSARPNPQVWYTGSAVDQESMEHGHVFARVRARAVKGGDPALAYFGWSAPADTPDEVDDALATDPAAWAAANPGLGIRISLEHVEREQRSMDPRTFAVERLGVGDWPDPNVTKGQGIDAELWSKLTDTASTIEGKPAFAFDVKPDRSGASICAGGFRPDGLAHVEVVEHRRGTAWLVDRLIDLKETHGAVTIVCDQASPAMTFVGALADAGIDVRTTTTSEHAQACGGLFDAVDQRTLRHLGTPELHAAIRGAVKRPLGEAWGWSRRSSAVDITPLVSGTLAHWAIRAVKKRPKPTFEVIA
jgi:hypothetical protein